MALTDILVSYWQLNEASGNALDVHSTNDLTVNNAVGSAAGKIGNARDFEAGSNQYFSRADNAPLSLGDIEFGGFVWVQLESKGSDRVILVKGDADSLEQIVQYDTETDRFQFYAASGAGFANLTPVTANTLGSPALDTWYFIVWWHDPTANTLNIQVDNGAVDSVSYSAGSWDSAKPFYVGNYPDYPSLWDGLLDELAFAKGIWTSEERTQLWNGGAGLAYPLVVDTGGGGAFGGSFPLRRTYRPRPFAPGFGR